MKTLKRTMAAEFSRELGVKVFAGKVRLVCNGFRVGGSPGYGLRRMLVSANGEYKGILAPGDHKSYCRDRVVLVPGPEHEQKVIKRIYELMFNKVRCKRIADQLNSENILFIDGRQWHYSRALIRATKGIPCETQYYRRFGNL
jgi:hypothetical protein